MVNPVLTLLFDLFLVGSAVAIIAAMVQEYLASRRPSVGGRMEPTLSRRRSEPRAGAHSRQGSALRKVA
jgi:hypothetical protein